MINPEDIEQRRSPQALRDFVSQLRSRVRADNHERHLGIEKKGRYKKFLDEIVPLSSFAIRMYPETYKIQPILENQGYDALVFDESGKQVDKIEITIPHDGATRAKDAKQIIEQGFGEIQTGIPGDDFYNLFPCVLKACHNKAKKDYTDCSVVIAIDPMPPFESFETRYESQIESLILEMRKIQFRSKRVFLLVMPDTIRQVSA